MQFQLSSFKSALSMGTAALFDVWKKVADGQKSQ